MYGFKDPEVIAREAGVTLWRANDTMLIQVVGQFDDAGSDLWRSLATQDFVRQQYPRFIAVDFSRSDPHNSMAARYRSAAFVRETMKRIEYGVVLSGASAGPTVVVRAVLRALGLPNLELMTSEPDFTDAIASMRRGARPKRYGSSATS